jgi:hypothetical protein
MLLMGRMAEAALRSAGFQDAVIPREYDLMSPLQDARDLSGWRTRNAGALHRKKRPLIWEMLSQTPASVTISSLRSDTRNLAFSCAAGPAR